MNSVYETPAYKIGKTEWKLVVYENPDCILAPSVTGEPEFMRGIARMTVYQYNDHGVWRDHTLHPRYNSNDGSYAGLPRGLKKIFKRHETDINTALIVTDRKLRAL